MKTLRFLLKGANLQGVKMLCSNAEGASLKGCNFEDPSGLKANLEGNPSQFLMNVGSSLPFVVIFQSSVFCNQVLT